jgi:hydroxymethylglutaryl-CoA reductase
MPGFYALAMDERVARIARAFELTRDEVASLHASGALPREVADRMVENAIGTMEVPLGLGLNFVINGREYVVPMAVEEPSVVAAVSYAAKAARAAGGFTAEADPQWMTAQIQVCRYGDADRARERVLDARDELLALADSLHPSLVARGGGAREVSVRVLPADDGGEAIFVVHLDIDVQDAMGANLVNTVAEGVAPLVEALTGGRVYLRILTNLADRRLARSRCELPVADLADRGVSGDDICEGVVQASRFADADPHRAATHNKGIMNGVDAVALATGNDWRAIEAGAHAWAARDGRYRPLSQWRRVGDRLVGTLEMPMQVGTVGGPIRVHPIARLALRILGVSGARELAAVMAAVGLAQNFSALRALGTFGIQEGHMALHARCVAVTAGARGADVERLAERLVASRQVKVEKARELLAAMIEAAHATDARTRVTAA